MSTVAQAVSETLHTPLKIDIGCGKNKKAGFIGIDQYAMEGVDLQTDLRYRRWQFSTVPSELAPRMLPGMIVGEGFCFADNSVDEAHCSHFLEHLTNLGDRWERVNFFNELHRILKPGAQCQLILPHWASARYYGDPTHKEPFSEWGFLYLNRDWRLTQGNAPHADISVNPNGYSCDFDWGYAYSLHQSIAVRNQEYQQHALTFWKESAQDIIATITKRPATTG